MRLLDWFNATRPVVTTTTPTGRVNHVRYGERPWDYNDYEWTTYNHPVRYEMTRNKFGSYDVDQLLKMKTLKWSRQSLGQHLSKQDALNILISREVQTMRDFGGFKKGINVGQLQSYIADNKFSGNHIFTYVKKNPGVLDKWLETAVEKPKAPATPPKQQPAASAHP